MITTNIIQIIPCPVELHAKFKQDGGEFTNRVICLALVEETDDEHQTWRRIIGVEWCDDEISLVTDSSNFSGYTDKLMHLKSLENQ